MVWSGNAVLMSGKTDSIKFNYNPGCLPGNTFVYSEVFKLDFSSASTHLKSSFFSIMLFLFGYDAFLPASGVVLVAAEVPARVSDHPSHPHQQQEYPQRPQGNQP
ncbi:hypothetical protein Tco_1462879, partial [Tanacetum coccineum]